jgi:hypothetical protein
LGAIRNRVATSPAIAFRDAPTEFWVKLTIQVLAAVAEHDRYPGASGRGRPPKCSVRGCGGAAEFQCDAPLGG